MIIYDGRERWDDDKLANGSYKTWMHWKFIKVDFSYQWYLRKKVWLKGAHYVKNGKIWIFLNIYPRQFLLIWLKKFWIYCLDYG